MSKNQNNATVEKRRKPWPADCLWPEPLWNGNGYSWSADEIDIDWLARTCPQGKDLADVKEYMEHLVEIGRLNQDYSLNEDYEDDDEDADEPFSPEIGEDYWDDGFDIEGWEEAATDVMNSLMFDASIGPNADPSSIIASIIMYNFDNQNLLRQAFTRRAFMLEYGLTACSEELEFYGDQILSTIVTREIYKKFSDPFTMTVEGPFQSLHDEGELSRMRAKFLTKEHLAARAVELGLDKYILYGSCEIPSESAREDMIEALIGAIAVETNWNWRILEDVVDTLVNIQLSNTSELLRTSSYEALNRWHQKHFGYVPEYSVYRDYRDKDDTIECYGCTLRYSVPANDKGIRDAQRIDIEGAQSRTMARETAAKRAIAFIQSNGLWMNLADAGIEPDLENSINQLQELFQKKYVSEPKYKFSDEIDDRWHCECICGEFAGSGVADSKVKAKKKAAYCTLIWIMESAGICKDEWKRAMWKMKAAL